MSLVLSFLFVLLVAASVDAQATDSCQSNYGSLAQAVKAVDALALPTAQFNQTCLALACPDLRSVPCPFNPNTREHNTTAINILIPAIMACVKSVDTLCGVPIKTIPICPAGVTLKGLFPTLNLDGTISLMPETGTITGIPSTVFTYDEFTEHGLLNVNVMISGQLQGNLGQFSFSKVPLSVTVAMEITIHIDSANKTTPVVIIRKNVSPTYNLGNFFPDNTDDQQSQDSVTKFQDALKQLTGQPLGTSFADDVGLFYGHILENMCLLSQENCKKPATNVQR